MISRSIQNSSINMSFTSRSVSIMSPAMPYLSSNGSPSKNSEKPLKEVKVNLMKEAKVNLMKKRKDVLMLATRTVAMAEENGARRPAY